MQIRKMKVQTSLIQYVDEPEAWYSNENIIILHGAGGVNGARYNNSKEGIVRGICCGYKVIEIDLGLTAEKVPVLTYRFKPDDEIIFQGVPSLSKFLSSGALEGETPLTLEMFIEQY